MDAKAPELTREDQTGKPPNPNEGRHNSSTQGAKLASADCCYPTPTWHLTTSSLRHGIDCPPRSTRSASS